MDLLDLSDEVLELILGFLDLRSLCRVAQTCRRMAGLRWESIDCSSLRHVNILGSSIKMFQARSECDCVCVCV
jgi:hypothetical protein